MVDQNTFLETVQNVAEIIRTSAEPMSEEEILSYFADMELDEKQKNIVMEYLMNPQTDIEEENEEATEQREQSEDMQETSAVFRFYLDELSELQACTEKEEMQMYEALLKGDQTVIARLSECWLERVHQIANQYKAPKILVEDLVQEGNMALFLALQELCGQEKQTGIKEKIQLAIETGMMAYISELKGERELENAMLGKVSLVFEAQKLLREENGTEPTLEELAEYTRLSLEELRDILTQLSRAKREE